MSSRLMRFLLLAATLASPLACTARGGGSTDPIDTDAGDDTPVVTDDEPAVTPDQPATCASPRVMCSSGCVDPRTDANNCGSCGNRCDSGTCAGGACMAIMPGCTAPRTLCSGSCTDPRADPTNCGACGVRCATGQVCADGSCVGGTGCAAPRVMCGATCTDLNTDATNCGVCGLRCASGQSCSAGNCTGGMMTCTAPQQLCAGFCTDVSFDLNHCGRCNNPCPSGQACVSGRCGGGTTCTAPRTMCSGVCVDPTTDITNCGGCGLRCATGQSCTAGRCGGGTTGGTAGSACTRNSDCPSGACISAGEGYPGGYCIFACPASSSPGDPCNGNGLCLPVSTTQNICFRECTPGGVGECRSGYVCESVTEDDSVGICSPDCRSNPALTCGAYRCQSDGVCGPVPCTTTSCSTGSTCSASTQRCECGTSTSCGASRRCYPRSGTTAPFCGCTSSSACAADETCNTATGRCGSLSRDFFAASRMTPRRRTLWSTWVRATPLWSALNTWRAACSCGGTERYTSSSRSR